MPPSRYRQFSQAQEIVFPFGPAIAPPAQSAEQKQAVDLQVEVNKQARARSVEFAGRDTSFAQYGVLPIVRFNVARGFVDIVNFTVPPSRVLIVSGVDLYLSEPACLSDNQMGWRLVSDQGQVVNHLNEGTVASPRTDIFPSPYSGIQPRQWFAPVYFQAGETMSVQLVELRLVNATTFDEFISASAWVWGELRKTAGGH